MSEFNLAQTEQPRMVPHAVSALIFGIAGCLHGWQYGFPGILLGIIGLRLCKKAEGTIYLSLTQYRGYNVLSAARKWSNIAIVQGIILIFFWFFYFFGLLSLPDLFRNF